MNRQETVQVITLLAGNYNSIAEKDKNQKQLMINTWLECLGDLEYNVVMQAVKKSIIESPYPPTIHDVRKNAVEIIKPSSSKTAIEAWGEALGMIQNGIYMTEEQFNSHSNEVKKFFSNVRQVRELAMVDSETINTVTKGQFLKQYEIIQQREFQNKLIPDSVKTLIGSFVKTLEEGDISE